MKLRAEQSHLAMNLVIITHEAPQVKTETSP